MTRAVAAPWLWLWLGLWIVSVGAALLSPSATVREVIDGVLATLDDPALSDAERQVRVLGRIGRHFDFAEMTRRTLATNWDKADPAERQRITALFRELLINIYWQKIAGYEGEIDVLDEQIRDGIATVRTSIRTPDANIPVDYKLDQREDGWYAYDVVIEQISLVRNYRATFLDEVHRGGIPGLIAALEERVQDTLPAPE